jgi:hypothetical protein
LAIGLILPLKKREDPMKESKKLIDNSQKQKNCTFAVSNIGNYRISN